MDKISLVDLEQVLVTKTKDKPMCIELHFCVDGSQKFTSCWLGKFWKANKDVYWLGLVEDGTAAYEFDSKEQLLSAKVLEGNNLQDIWGHITVYSIDSCAPKERLCHYKSMGDI